MQVPDLPILALFAATLALLCCLGLTTSAMFPAEGRPPRMQTIMGKGLIYLAMVIGGALLVQAVRLAVHGLDWEVILVSACLIVLFTPLLHQVLPDALRSGGPGVAAFGGLGLVLHAAIWMQLNAAEHAGGSIAFAM